MPNAWTVLIIDDSAADRKIYRRYLLRDPHQSYQILEADSAEEGIALCQQKRCDLILVDFCLPNMNGLEFLDWLKQQRFENPVPAILLTGRGDEEIAVQAMKRGARDYLVKQLLKQEVLQLSVRNAIEQSYLQTLLEKTQERQRLIAMTSLRIRQSLDLEQILHTAAAEVQQLLKCDRVIVYQFLSNQDGRVVASSVEQLEIVGSGTRSREYQTWGAQDRVQEESVWHIPSHPFSQFLHQCCSNSLEHFNIKANHAVPIILSNDGNPKPWGLLIAHQCSKERRWQTSEQEMLNEVSVQLAIAIQQAELLAQSQAALVKEKQLNAFKSQIISTISHEYRTPLASILAGASTLKQNRERLDEVKQNKFLQIIEQKARHLSKLVDDMLIYNQFELDKVQFRPASLDLTQFFSDLIEEQRQTTNTSHELRFYSVGNNGGFWGDKGLLRLIFDNIMSNAIKYSPSGGDIEFYLIGEDSQIIFYIQDRGIGIPAADREHLFQPFNRGSNVDTISGTGLGLAIAKACVELHGGSIALESQPEQGTKVTISLPKQPL